MSEKAARVGFDWPDGQGARDKVGEELGELDEAVRAGDTRRAERELGDVLFALVNYARKLDDRSRGRAARHARRASPTRVRSVESAVAAQGRGGRPS